MTLLEIYLEQTAALHRHLCPRQVLGVRIGLFAAELFDLELPQTNKRLFCFVETDGCFADGVSVATGCWFGHRTMRLMDFGKVAATFVDTQTDRAIRIWPSPDARHHARDYCPEAADRWHAQLTAYQVMPDTELLCEREVSLTASLATIISRPGVRTVCDVCGEEIINERECLISGRTLCRSCAGEGYYSTDAVVSDVVVGLELNP